MPHSPYFTVRARKGFTVIEIIVIIIILGLMLVIIVPHILNGIEGRKAERVKADLWTLNSAIEHYALDNGKVGGVTVNYADLRKYLDPHTDVFRRNGLDVFGEAYGPFTVGTRPSVPARTADKLSETVAQDFWSPYPAPAGSH
jgi:type II secretory pathway pseudopilin PulG